MARRRLPLVKAPPIAPPPLPGPRREKEPPTVLGAKPPSGVSGGGARTTKVDMAKVPVAPEPGVSQVDMAKVPVEPPITPTTGIISLSQEQHDRILSGELKAPPETTKAVMEGNVKILTPAEMISPLEHTKRFLGIESLGVEHYLAAFGLATGVGGGAWLSGKSKAVKETIWRIGKIVKTPTGATISTKTFELTSSHLSKYFTKKTLTWAAAGVAAYTGSIGWGLWGYAEAPEGIGIIETKFLVPEARITGNWTFVDEAEKAKKELMDLSIWQKVGLWSPLSPIVGSELKSEGNAEGAILMAKHIEDSKYKQENGLTEADMYAKAREEREASEKRIKDYNSEVFRRDTDYMNAANAAAKAVERAEYAAGRESERAKDKKYYEEQAAYWARERDKEREKARADMQAIAKFWLEYAKLKQEIADNNRPSNLNFGLL